MKESVWLFMWLLDKMTSINEQGIGLVLGGKPIKYSEVKDDLGISEKTYNRWVNQLRIKKYINTKRTPYGLILSVNKAKKRWAKSVNNKDREPTKKAVLLDKNVGSNKTASVNSVNSNILIKGNERRVIPTGEPPEPIDQEGLKKLREMKSGLVRRFSIPDRVRTSAQEEALAIQRPSGKI